jgi:hypothetical protein
MNSLIEINIEYRFEEKCEKYCLFKLGFESIHHLTFKIKSLIN